MTKKRRFGVPQTLSQGLRETINVVENDEGAFRNAVVPITRLELDPDNPRKLMITMDDLPAGPKKNDAKYAQKQSEFESLKSLSETIKSSGVINPIVVYKLGEKYRVVAGERRTLASIIAGKTELDARVYQQRPNPFDLKLVQWVENTAREDLSLNEKIGNIKDLVKEFEVANSGEAMSAKKIVELTGLSSSQAHNYMTILEADDTLVHAIVEGKIKSLDKAVLIQGAKPASLRAAAIEQCAQGASLQALRKFIQENKKKPEKVEKKSRAGRPAVQVNMGSTKKPHVAKAIIDAVISTPKYQAHASLFKKVDWAELEEATKAFRQLISILEKEMSEQNKVEVEA